MSELSLYYMPTCPYCGKVIQFMRENDICILLKDIAVDESSRKKLIEMGGKSQVPCLVIDQRALYESDDIIEWLKNNYRK
ncbi:MAG: glutathione S-transferase N-terminal domain-containing protein [Candidatus Zapsychrus exili]|nr:glutathione S-transferase N-terminal domain-containing protein [Candidatus Zapsychrus exili]